MHLNARKEAGKACSFTGEVHPAVAGENAVRVQGKDVGTLSVKFNSFDQLGREVLGQCSPHPPVAKARLPVGFGTC